MNGKHIALGVPGRGAGDFDEPSELALIERLCSLLILHLTSVIRQVERIAEREVSRLFFDDTSGGCATSSWKTGQAKNKAQPSIWMNRALSFDKDCLTDFDQW